MAYKAWNNYEDAAHERWRSLPWHERYSWRGLALFALIVAIVAAYAWTKFSG